MQNGSKFLFSIASLDTGKQFYFEGIYFIVTQNILITFTLSDNQKGKSTFSSINDKVTITQTFKPETANIIELQLNGWRELLINFKKIYGDLNLVTKS